MNNAERQQFDRLAREVAQLRVENERLWELARHLWQAMASLAVGFGRRGESLEALFNSTADETTRRRLAGADARAKSERSLRDASVMLEGRR